MKMKMIVVFVSMLMIATAIPLTSASNTNKTNNKICNPTTDTYNECYIEASGKISEKDWPAIIRLPNMWKTFWFRFLLNDERAFVSFWRIIFQSNAEVTIFTEQNGEVLWEHQGEKEVQLIILGYVGIYNPESSDDGPLHVTISGTALRVDTKLI